jgi:hypothetical protein
LPVDQLADRRADERAKHACRTVEASAAPLDRTVTGMLDKPGGGIRRDRESACADRKMRVWYANDINHQRDREDGAAAAEHAESEADETSGEYAEGILNKAESHPRRRYADCARCGFAISSRPLSIACQ